MYWNRQHKCVHFTLFMPFTTFAFSFWQKFLILLEDIRHAYFYTNHEISRSSKYITNSAHLYTLSPINSIIFLLTILLSERIYVAGSDPLLNLLHPYTHPAMYIELAINLQLASITHFGCGFSMS